MSGTPIVILAGQSNAVLPSLPMGVADAVGAQGAIIVHHAVSGSPLSTEKDTTNQGDWEATGVAGSGELLDVLFEKIDAVLTPGSAGYIEGAYISGMVWVQGETDAISRVATAEYEENLQLLHDVIVDRYGDHEMVLSMLSQDASEARLLGVHNPVREEGTIVIRDAQTSVGEDNPSVTVIDPDVLAATLGVSVEEMFLSDYIHYTEEFGYTLGATLGDELAVSGGASLQVGTLESDFFTIDASVTVHQLLGFNSNDTVDFSGLNFAINVNAYLYDITAVEAVDPANALEVTMTRVETVIGTDFADTFVLGQYTRKVESGAGNDHVVGWDGGSDNLKLGDGADYAFGGRGDDSMRGGAGKDRLKGGKGADKLFGEGGRDVLKGGNGDDWVYGGDGNDVIFTGNGSDEIVYRNNESGKDKVKDFVQGEDVIYFQSMGLAMDDLEFSTPDGNMVVSVETSRSDIEIVLVGGAGLTLTEDDFLF